MLDFLRDAPGVLLSDEEYDKDLDERWERAPAHDSWKLERRQHFVEPWSDSWQAFARGDWDEVLRLDDARAADLLTEGQRDAERGIRTFRLRIVETPISPYLQWELHGFRQQVAAGELIRVVGPEVVAPFEGDGLVPELLNIGPDTLYEVVYDDDGLAVGAVRYSDADCVAAFTAFMERLYARGEDFTPFFNREVATLPPPRSPERRRLDDDWPK